jgi:two-component system catabolic regulation response regulator CreB/two-component system response regulator ChvI
VKNGRRKRPIKILVVDDEPDILGVLKKGLEHEGFTVDTNNKPLDVLQEYAPGKYDLLILDIRTPELDGFELYRKIREIDSKVKVCFITAFEVYFDEFRRVFPKIHVSCFIHKPITIKQLVQAVREELARPIVEEDEPAIKQVRQKESELQGP